jgi:hypothetical protein
VSGVFVEADSDRVVWLIMSVFSARSNHRLLYILISSKTSHKSVLELPRPMMNWCSVSLVARASNPRMRPLRDGT